MDNCRKRNWVFAATILATLVGQRTSLWAQSARERADQEKKEAEEKAKEREKKEAERKALRADVAKKLQFEIVFPDGPATVRRVNSIRYKFDIKVTNPTETPATIAPFFNVKVFDADGEEVRAATYTERSRPKSAQSKTKQAERADEVRFLTVPAGKSRLIPASFAKFDHDPRFNIAYKFARSGSYEVRMIYGFNKEKFVKLFALEDFEHLDDEDRQWNSVHEMTRNFSAKLKIE